MINSTMFDRGLEAQINLIPTVQYVSKFDNLMILENPNLLWRILIFPRLEEVFEDFQYCH